MILILKRISESTLVPDIESFISPALKGGLFSKPGNLVKISIQMLTAANSDKAEFNALVRVEPDAAAMRIIKQLNRKPLNGKPINIAEYSLRLRNNDRRGNSSRLANDRRRQDRRRSELQLMDVTAQRITDVMPRAVKGWETDITL
ncbi:RNA-binding protein [Methylomonas sp. SURF-2]|uniref:RNA-binding protein n=1 Tax=Methylomonas subterranea TaxID=2952225 RepID=A0ABT1TD36_9GAMM|nr:RNA-binding protein [Methylomonas sp. SURF-2]MCQ8103373.1 RNA-binding protein [Methylomonas sp. SURF-2]